MYPERAACQAWQILVPFTTNQWAEQHHGKELMHRHGDSKSHKPNKTYSDSIADHWAEVHFYFKDALYDTYPMNFFRKQQLNYLLMGYKLKLLYLYRNICDTFFFQNCSIYFDLRITVKKKKWNNV